jgi:hypothetical protein
MRRTWTLPLSGTQIAIRGLIFAGLREAQLTHSEIRFDDETSREECLLIAGAMRISQMSGDSEEREVESWLKDFQRYVKGVS